MEEHMLFVEGLRTYNKQWRQIAELIRTRTVVQIRTHAQKYFQKIQKQFKSSDEVDMDDMVCNITPLITPLLYFIRLLDPQLTLCACVCFCLSVCDIVASHCINCTTLARRYFAACPNETEEGHIVCWRDAGVADLWKKCAQCKH